MLHAKRIIHSFLSILLIFFLLLSSVQVQPVAAQDEGGDIRRELNAENGKVNFIGGQNGQPVQLLQALGRQGDQPPVNPGKALVQQYGPEFGLKNPASELTEKSAVQLANGKLNFRYQQVYNGIPVLAGELIVNTNDKGDLYSITGEVSSDLALSTEAAVAAESAQADAVGLVVKAYGGDIGDFVSTQPE